MDELEAIASDRHIPLVDNIAIVDEDRERLASFVHLTNEANLRLAEALKEALEPILPDGSHKKLGSSGLFR